MSVMPEVLVGNIATAFKASRSVRARWRQHGLICRIGHNLIRCSGESLSRRAGQLMESSGAGWQN
jgi:hypothetical protein